MAEKVTSDALQIHGGSGYTTDFPVERYWRDTRLTKPEAGLRPWSTFVVNAAAGGLDLQQSATGLGGQAEATVAVGSGAVHTIVVGGAGESIRSAKLCLPGPAVGAATATGRAARRRTRTRRSPARAEAAGPRGLLGTDVLLVSGGGGSSNNPGAGGGARGSAGQANTDPNFV